MTLHSFKKGVPNDANFLFIAVESHLLQCDYSKVPCPTCGQSTKREVIEGHLHKQAKEISQREAEREEAKEKIIELEDSLASMKSELDDAIEVFDFSYSYGTNRRGVYQQSVKIYFSTFEHRLSRERQHVEIVQLYSSIIYALEECGYTDASCNRLCHSLVYRRPKYDVTRLDGIPIGSWYSFLHALISKLIFLVLEAKQESKIYVIK